MGFERVYTVWDYYDGVRSGIAECSGSPHYYCCEWDINAGDYADTFILTPVNNETLSLALEQWAIWLEWECKFHRGEAQQSTHPGLTGQHQRYAELKAILDKRISESSTQTKRARATFRPLPSSEHSPPGRMRQFEVEWDIGA
jgi:hypothetical protein